MRVKKNAIELVETINYYHLISDPSLRIKLQPLVDSASNVIVPHNTTDNLAKELRFSLCKFCKDERLIDCEGNKAHADCELIQVALLNIQKEG